MKGSIVYFGRESGTKFPGRRPRPQATLSSPGRGGRRHETTDEVRKSEARLGPNVSTRPILARTTVGEPVFTIRILSDCEFVVQAVLIIIKLSQATILASKPALRPHTWAGPGGGNQQPGGREVRGNE